MLYSCKPLFDRIKAELKKEIETFPDAPRVCIITTGEDEPSQRRRLVDVMIVITDTKMRTMNTNVKFIIYALMIIFIVKILNQRRVKKMRLIDADALLDKQECLFMKRHILFHGVTAYTIESAPTIDPETLPIVQELRKEMERVTRERDEAVEQLRRDCERCSHYKVTWNGCTPDFECPLSDRCLNRDMWEWVGIQEVQEDEQL